MAAPQTELRLALAAKAENLALVRQALSGLAEGNDIPERPLADLKQIATEACMNAVVHAYPDREDGRIDVRALVEGDEVEIRVRDWGIGFRPRPADSDKSLRLGLPLIASVVESFGIEAPDGGGTALVARVRVSEAPAENAEEMPAAPSEAEVDVTVGESARPVISRIFAIAATRAGFSLDRMSDGILFADAISAGNEADFAEGRVGVEIEECGPALCLRVGPLSEGGAKRLLEQMELPGMGVSISKLADRVEVEQSDRGEYLAVEFSPESAGAAA